MLCSEQYGQMLGTIRNKVRKLPKMFKNLKTLPSAEECGEAVQAALKYDYRADEITKQALITEIADLEIMVQQIKLVVGYEKVNKEIDFKLNRQLERIKNARKIEEE